MPELLTFNELREQGVLYTRRWIAELEAAGKFPKRVHLGPGRVGWDAKEIKKWVDDKKKARK